MDPDPAELAEIHPNGQRGDVSRIRNVADHTWPPVVMRASFTLV
jgi:hypothetical protein